MREFTPRKSSAEISAELGVRQCEGCLQIWGHPLTFQEMSPNLRTSPEISGECLIFPQRGNISASTLPSFRERVVSRNDTPAVREFTHNGNTYTEYLLSKRDICRFFGRCLAERGVIHQPQFEDGEAGVSDDSDLNHAHFLL